MPKKVVKKKLIIEGHKLVPEHKLVSDKEKEKLLEKYHITVFEFPKILKSEPALDKLSPKPGDLIQITRKSESAGNAVYYRVVING